MTQTANPAQIDLALRSRWEMRVGKSLGRTLYLVDPEVGDPMVDLCVGIVDSPRLADAICQMWNQAR